MTGTILVGLEVSGQKICHFAGGGQRGGVPYPEGDYGLGHSGALSASSPSTPAPDPWAPRMATGGQCEPGHLAGIHQEVAAQPACPGGRQPRRRGPALSQPWQSGPPCPAQGALGPGFAWVLGIFLMSTIIAPPHAQAHTHTHTPAPHHARFAYTHRPSWLQRHQMPPWECRGALQIFLWFLPLRAAPLRSQCRPSA